MAIPIQDNGAQKEQRRCPSRELLREDLLEVVNCGFDDHFFAQSRLQPLGAIERPWTPFSGRKPQSVKPKDRKGRDHAIYDESKGVSVRLLAKTS
jgi:hypothetical protein